MDAARLERGGYRAALIAAAAAGDAETVHALADGPCPPDVSPATKASFMSVALLRAARGGHLETVKALARVPDAHADASDASRVDVSRANADGNTPLHLACERGDARCVDVLLALGANLAARNAEGKTPIALARTGGIRAAVAAEVARRRDADATSTRAPATSRDRSSDASPAPAAAGRGRRTPSGATDASASPGSAAIRRKLRDDLKCAVCLRDFCSDGTGSAPVTLPCGHNFCAECVGGMRGTGDEEQRRAFRCPLDRAMVSRRLELRVNGAMRDLVDFLRGRARGSLLGEKHECADDEGRRAVSAARGGGGARGFPADLCFGFGKENEVDAPSRSPKTPSEPQSPSARLGSISGGGSGSAARWGWGKSPSPRTRALR